jgi:hypothetical protein
VKLIGYGREGDSRCLDHVDFMDGTPIYEGTDLHCTYCGEATQVSEVELCHCGGTILPSSDQDVDLHVCEYVCGHCGLVYT